ncbi:MAG: DUF4153 domain-containing protein, partial [Patescibacteria group bacterium]
TQKLKKVFFAHWLAGLLSFSTAVFFIFFNNQPTEFIFLKLTLIGFFLTFTSLSISTFFTTIKTTRWHHLFHYFSLIFLGLILFAFLPTNEGYLWEYRGFMLGCFVASLMLFLPFYKNSRNLDFVNYVKNLGVNFIVAVGFSLIVYAGLAVFGGILKDLFTINIPELVYAGAFSLVFTTIGFWIFVYLLPDKMENIDFYKTLDSLLNILAVYILLPFSIIYSITLCIYAGKIIFTNIWPQNQVAIFVGALFVVLLVIYFLIQSATGDLAKKIKNFWRYYFVGCLPLLALYFIALVIRIKNNGFTEDRCLALFVGFVCLFAGLYLVIDKSVKLKYIPITIGVIMLLMSFGPWSIFNISKHSQVSRYEEFLIANEFIVNGKINEAKKLAQSDKLFLEFSQKTNYIIYHFEPESIKRFFPDLDLTEDNSMLANKMGDLYLVK